MMDTAVYKAVILARGLGTRMRRADDSAVLSDDQMRVADSGVKAMIPIGRPFLDYVISGLADAGYTQVCLVIGPEHQSIRKYYTDESPARRIQVSFAVQERPCGTADAVLASEAFVGRDLFLVLNSDNYYPTAVCQSLRKLRRPAAALFERDSLVSDSNIPPERLRKFAVAKVDGDGFLETIFEKPDETVVRTLERPVYVSMNCWLFSPLIFSACRSIQPSSRGELELTDAVGLAINSLGERFRVLAFKAPVLDLSSRSDIRTVTEMLRGIQPDP